MLIKYLIFVCGLFNYMLVVTVGNINIGLDVPTLPDNDVWFANNAAWINYWKTQTFDVSATINPIVVANYTFFGGYDASFVDTPITISAVNYDFLSYAAAIELEAHFQQIETNYRSLRSALKVAGLIDEEDN